MSRKIDTANGALAGVVDQTLEKTKASRKAEAAPGGRGYSQHVSKIESVAKDGTAKGTDQIIWELQAKAKVSRKMDAQMVPKRLYVNLQQSESAAKGPTQTIRYSP